MIDRARTRTRPGWHKPGRYAAGWYGAGLATAVCASILPTAASAQIIDSSTVVVPPRQPRPSVRRSAFVRDRDVPVAERTFPAFTAQGIRLGPLEAFPALMVAPEYISNIFANNANRRSAAALLLRPELTVRNRSGPIDLDLFARGAITRVAKYSTENTEDIVGGGRIGSEIGPLTSVFVGGSYGRRVLPRYASDSPVNALKPLEYDELLGNIGGQIERGRFRLVLRGDLTRLRFDSTPMIGGGTLFTGDRDRTVLAGTARAEYAFKPDTTIYLAATVNRFNYRLPFGVNLLNRDSHGEGIYIGTSLDITGRIRADARVGYIRQQFDAGGTKPISGLGLLGTVYVFPTRLTTVTLRGERSVRDTGVPGTLGDLYTGGEFRVDHELRRFFTATAIAGYSVDDYRGSLRRDRNAYAAVSALYLSKDHWSAKVGYQYNRRHGTPGSTGTEFDDHRILVALTFQR